MGAPKGNKYALKPIEQKAKPCTFKLKPETIAKINEYAASLRLTGKKMSKSDVIALAVSLL